MLARRSLSIGRACWAVVALLGCGATEHGASAGSTTSTAGAPETAGAGGSLTVMVAGGTGGSGGDCERQVSLQAVTLGEPAPFDLVIVADHSMSLAWSRDDLSSGLKDLLTHVQGRQVRVFLLTPTQYGASSAAARIPLTGDPAVSWQDPATGSAYEDAVTEYSQSCTDPAGAAIDCPDPRGKVPYKVQGKWSFVMPEPVATLAPGMSAADFASEAEAVKSAILAIGGKGSPQEQPLCTLARYISQPAALLPKNAVFLLITDEDDVSRPDDCVATFEAELRSTRAALGATPCSSGCDAYRYGMKGTRHWQRMPFTCAAFDDTGTRIAGTDESSWYNLNFGTSCDGITPGACTTEERATIEPFCESGLKLAECTRECATDEITCSVDLPTPDVDACTSSFSYGGQTYANLAAYCAGQVGSWRDCTGGGVTIQYQDSISGSYDHTNVTPGKTDTRDIGAYFKTTASQVFAPGGFLLQGIVLDPSFSCALGRGQSYATNLVQFIGDKSHVFPLCESYAPALDGVLGFASSLIQTEFTLRLEPDEHVSAVVVVSQSGQERKLATSAYHFQPETGVLEVERSAIDGSDSSLRVEITSDCRPVVR